MTLKLNGIFRRTKGQDIVHRWEGNPLIGLSDLDFQVSDIHNASAVAFQDQPLLLVTIETLSGQRCVHLARPNKDGIFKVDLKPFLKPSTDPSFLQHEINGVLDARSTFLDETYYIMYNALGEHGYRLGIAKTDDFKTVERLGIISEPDTKAGVLFPEKIKGNYARLERPGTGNIWVTYSPDLKYWGRSELVLTPRGGYWDPSRIGIGPAPLKTDHGWLVIYYGVKDTSAGPIYRIGAALLDMEDPTRIIGRTGVPILSPREMYERLGDMPNLVFCTGALLDEEGTLHLFYGASNSCICLGTTTIPAIMDQFSS